MAEDRWLTYSAAAAALGMTPESVRQRARREHWAKRLNNEGKATVLVPLDATGDTGGDAPGDAGGAPTEHRPVKRPEIRPEPEAGVVHQLQERIVELRADIERERAELTRERQERGEERDRADKLAGELRAEAERERAERRRERDRADQLAGQVTDLARRMAEVVVADQHRARPWWRRLTG